MNLSPAANAIVLKMQQNELTESVIYEKIARFAKGEENRSTLLRLAREERAHYEIWKKYTGVEMKPEKGKVLKFTMIARILGFTFAVKLMERGEGNAQVEYALLAEEVAESVHIRQQEEEHEHALLAMLDEERLRYVGSMVLGLNDALVELTGSLAGFTFALQNTRLIALSGLIIGISATFSMASSEFLAARSEGRSDALKSCTYTGIAYLITVVLLIAPYLLLTGGLEFSQMTDLGWGMLLVVGIVHTGIAYALYFGGIRDVNAQTAAILSYLDPVLSILLSALILRERLDVFSVIGAVLILGSALYSELPERKK